MSKKTEIRIHFIGRTASGKSLLLKAVQAFLETKGCIVTQVDEHSLDVTLISDNLFQNPLAQFPPALDP